MKIKRWQLVLIIALLIVFAAVCIYAAIEMFTGGVQIGKKGTYENGWSKDIVTKIVDGDVPVPDGFEYVSGTKSTGVIIKNKNTGALYIWIPTSLENGEIEDYESKISSIFGELTATLSSDLLENISTYGGFYVGISGEDIVDIAGMTEEEYKLAREKANELYGDSKSVSSILVNSNMLVAESLSDGSLDQSDVTPNKTTGKDLRALKEDAKFMTKQNDKITLTAKKLKAGNSVQYLGREVISGTEYAKIVYTTRENAWHGWEYYDHVGYIPLSALGLKEKQENKTTDWITNNDIVYMRKSDIQLKPGSLKTIDGKEIAIISSFDTPIIRIAVNNKLGYSKIKFDGKEYIIKSSDITTEKPKNSTEIQTPEDTTTSKTGTTVYAQTNTTLYSNSSLSGAKGTVNKGTELEEIKTGEKASYVKYKNNYYYVDNKNISTTKPSTEDDQDTTLTNPNEGSQKPTTPPVENPNGGSQNTTGDKNPTGNENTTTPVEQPKVTDPEEGYKADSKTVYIKKDANEIEVWCNGNTQKLKDVKQGKEYTIEGATANWVKTTEKINGEAVWLHTEDVSEIKPDNRSNLQKILENTEEIEWNGDSLVLKTPRKTFKENHLEETKNTYGEYIDIVLKDDNGDNIPIPKGFSYYSGETAKEGISVVYNSSKVGDAYRLKYVWIPVDDITNVKSKFIGLYNEGKSEDKQFSVDYYDENLDTEDLDPNLVESIKKYGGFYMSEAELGVDDEGNLYNRYRGMNVKSSNGNQASNVGDYFRTHNYTNEMNRPETFLNWVKNDNNWINKLTGKTVFSGTKQTLTYDAAKAIADVMFLSKPEDKNGKEIIIESEKDKSNKSAVVSHLTYGTEWNAAIVWLCETNDNDKILKDSTEIGKYKKHLLSDSAKISLNGLWGLGGNLAELTQEKHNGKQAVLRGGSYDDIGNEVPIAGRKYLSVNTNETDDTVGFRNCLYIKVGSEQEEQKVGKANAPVLGKGMTAVKWNGSKWEEVDNPDKDTSWYSYDEEGKDNKWANAQTEDGSMWVWIPRFQYKINKNNKTIDIKFLPRDVVESSGGYTIHPAFTPNVNQGGWDKELSGIWVSKYEASGNKEKIEFKNNKESLTNVTISEAYKLSKGYNENLNSHLIKNSEWGAVAYLAHSKYGRNGEEISINTTKKPTITGKPNTSASTTNNMYGVYDMSGGNSEFVSAYYKDGKSLSPKGQELLTKDNKSTKYVTVYYNNDDFYMPGDATVETINWNKDRAYTFNESNPFMRRGGDNSWNEESIGTFAYDCAMGGEADVIGFRTVLIVEESNKPDQTEIAKPSKVSNLKVNVKGKDITFTWDSVSDAYSYEIECLLGSNGTKKYTTTNNKLEITGVSNNYGICKAKVRAYKIVNKEKLYGTDSNEVVFKGEEDGTFASDIQKVSNVKVEVKNLNEAYLTWNSQDNIDGYEIAYAKDGEKYSTYEIGKKESRGIIDSTKLEYSSKYKAKVRAFSGDGDNKVYGLYSDEVSFETQKSQPEINEKGMGKVQNVKVTVNGKEAKVDWDITHNTDRYDIVVESNNSDKHYKTENADSKNSYTVTDLNKGIYHLRVRSYEEINGNTIYGPYSDEYSFEIK